MWLKLKEWADEYGPIYQTRAMGQTFIIISDETIAEELLVKGGHIYSGRLQIRSLIRHKEGQAYLALMDRLDRHDTWQKQRKWVHSRPGGAITCGWPGQAKARFFSGNLPSDTWARPIGTFSSCRRVAPACWNRRTTRRYLQAVCSTF